MIVSLPLKKREKKRKKTLNRVNLTEKKRAKITEEEEKRVLLPSLKSLLGASVSPPQAESKFWPTMPDSRGVIKNLIFVGIIVMLVA